MEQFFQQHVDPGFEVIPNIVAGVIALQLKQDAIAKSKTGANIYRSTIGFAGPIILAGSFVLIVSRSIHMLVLTNMVFLYRVQKYGDKSSDTGNAGCIRWWKKLENRWGNRHSGICIKFQIL